MTRLEQIVLMALIGALASPIMVDAQRGGGGNRGGQGNGRGVHTPPPVPPASATQGISVAHPLPGNLNTVQTAPVLGFGPPAPSPFAAQPGAFTRQHRPTGSYGSSIGYGYGFSTPGYNNTYPLENQPAAVDREVGNLSLDVIPATALAFVDTAYVGSAEDLRATGVRLSPGHHWLDLEATGYEKKTVEITVTPGQSLRYRADLTPIRSAALTVIPARPPETMYAIPGCYGGNRPPVAASLPAGCDIAKVRVVRPQPRTN